MEKEKGGCAPLKHMKGLRGFIWVAVLGVIGLLLVIVGGEGNAVQGGKTDAAASEESVRYYTEELENRIADLCRQIDGIHEAHVLLTLEGGTEHVYAENESGSSRDYVIMDSKSGDAPILIGEIYPKIRGVAVVCTHGGDSNVQRTVTELLAAALGIPSSRIRVAGT